MRCHQAVIVGAGPAGLSVARLLWSAGVRDVLCIERESEAGGVPRHCHHRGFGVRQYHRAYTGPQYARRLRRDAQAVLIRTRTSVVALERDGELVLCTENGLERIRAQAVLIATGMRETPRAARLVSGERPAGILTTGALQQLVSLAKHLPCRRPVVVGTEWVSFSGLLTLRDAGLRAVAMLEEGPRISAPRPGDLIARALFGVPVLTHTRLVRIIGTAHVEGVEIERDGARSILECDGVIFTGRFVPEASLIAQSHLELDAATGGPVVDQHWQCSDPAYFAAGNVLRPAETAGVCAREGEAAGRSIARYLAGRLPSPTARVRVTRGDSLRYVVPQVISTGAASIERLAIHGQVAAPFSGELSVLRNGQPIARRRLSALPHRRVTLFRGELNLEALESLDVCLDARRCAEQRRAVSPSGESRPQMAGSRRDVP